MPGIKGGILMIAEIFASAAIRVRDVVSLPRSGCCIYCRMCWSAPR